MDGVAQVVAYGLVMASMTEHADTNEDGIVQAGEAREALRDSVPLVAAAFSFLLDKPALFDAVAVEVAALELLVSAIDVAQVRRSAGERVNAAGNASTGREAEAKGRGETWLYFYEDFLATYDREERRQAGVYFTPTEVVNAMVRIVDHILFERFQKRLAFADPDVVTLDPATGTGTFPLAVMKQGEARAKDLRGPAGPKQAAQSFARNLFAFEFLPGPYAVAHLRLGERLTAMFDDGRPHSSGRADRYPRIARRTT